MTTMLLHALLMMVLTSLGSPAARMQTVTQTPTMQTGTATIESIDSTNRSITLHFDDDTTDTFTAGPEVRRFDELKVGQKVSFRYYESVAYTLRKAGSTAPAPAPEDTSALTPAPGLGPGGTIARQQTSTVTVIRVNPDRPSITVKRDDGHVATRLVKDRKHLVGIAPGDRIDITYTEALLVSVSPAP
jgi:hypothetical protein